MRASAGRVTGLLAPAQPRRCVLSGNLLSWVPASLAPGPAVGPRIADAGCWRINTRRLGHVDTAVLGCLTVEVRCDRARPPAELGALVAWKVAVQQEWVYVGPGRRKGGG